MFVTQDSAACLDHIRKVRQQAEERKAKKDARGDGKKDFVSQFYRYGIGDHRNRFVGNFFTSCVHYVGNGGKMGFLRLFPDEAFDSKADRHIPSKMVCANWDFERNEHNYEGPCLICALNNLAREIARSKAFKTQSAEDQQRWTSLKAKTGYKIEHNWNLIDRAHPEHKFYFIAPMGNELFDSLITNVHTKWEPRYFAGVEEGVDVSIVVSETSGKWKYSAALAINGDRVAMTPLTEEEKQWPLHNLSDRCGQSRIPDMALVRALMMTQWQTILPEVTAVTKPEAPPPAATPAATTPAPAATTAPATGKGKKGPF